MNRTSLISAGAPFAFNAENKKKIAEILTHYPPERRQSALLPVLDLAQRQNQNWISQEVVETIATTLSIPVMRVFEVASFYTMYNLRPVGQHFIQVCRTTPCWLRGSDDLKVACEKACEVDDHGYSKDGLFSIVEVECLGACVNAPVVQINDDFYEDLTPEKMTEIIIQLKSGKSCKPGPQIDRLNSAPLDFVFSKKKMQPQAQEVESSKAKVKSATKTKVQAKTNAQQKTGEVRKRVGR